MNKKIDTKQLGKIQETLIIPLLGRAQVSRRETGFFYDAKAIEIVDNLDYDYSKFDAAFPTLEGAVLRTRVLDKWLKGLLKRHPKSTVVEIGCGLNTRFERLDNGQLMWYDLDLPDVYAIWKHFFEEEKRRKFLQFSAFDEDWVQKVKKKGEGPHIFIMEGSVVYFEEVKVKQLWQMIADNFPDAYLIFDSVTKEWLYKQNRNHAMRVVKARLKWSIDDIYKIESWNRRYRIIKHENLLWPSKEISGIYPWWIRAATPFAYLLYGNSVDGYSVNMAHIRGPLPTE